MLGVSDQNKPSEQRSVREVGDKGLPPPPSAIKCAIDDLFNGFKLWHLWPVLAWHDLHQRYKRTWLSMGWIAVSFALFAFVKIVIFGPISGKSMAFYAANLATGFLIFRLIANFIAGGAAIYVGSQNWIKSEPIPLSVHLYKLVVKNFIIFGFAAIPAVIICLFVKKFDPFGMLSLPAALFIYALNGLWLASLLGIICARFRDVQHFVPTLVQILYFSTPILWVPPETGIRATIAFINPLTHYIAILRQPILEGTVPWQSWGLVGIYTLIGMTLSFYVFAFSRKRLIYWL